MKINKKKGLIITIILLLVVTSLSPVLSNINVKASNEYEPQVGAPAITIYYLSMIDHNGCISLVYTNQSDSHVMYEFSLLSNMSDALFYWDNASQDMGGGSFRYESQGMANTLEVNSTYYYRFTAKNGTNQALNNTVEGNFTLWLPNLTVNTPLDGAYEIDPSNPTCSLNISATSNGSAFNVTWYEGYYFSPTLLNTTTYTNNGTFIYEWADVDLYSQRYRWCAKIDTCYGRALPDNGFEGIRTIYTKLYNGVGEVNNWTFWTENDTIAITLVSATDINASSDEFMTYVFNITTNTTSLYNETILIASGVSPNSTLISYNWSFRIPASSIQPNLVRAHDRNENDWFEKFNSTGTDEIGTQGEWACYTLANSTGVTVLDWGTNYTKIQFRPASINLAPQLWYVDRSHIVKENKTNQYTSIYSNNMLRTKYNTTGQPSDTNSNWNWENATYHINFYANATSGTLPLNIYYANESFGNENPITSPNCVYLGSVTPLETYDWSRQNSSYYSIVYSVNNGTAGTVDMTDLYYIVFTSSTDYDDAWKLYYADGNTTDDGHYFDYLNTSVVEVSTTNGTTWYPFENSIIENHVLWLKFNEGVGDVCVDSTETYTEQYHNGTRQGATWSTSGYNDSYCLSFDGGDDYVNVSNDAFGLLNFTEQLTVSLWVNATSFGNNRYWVSKLGNFRFGTCADKERPCFDWYRDGSWKATQTDSDIFNADILYHVAATFDIDSETVVLYVNGTEVKRQTGFTGTGDMEVGSGDIFIGMEFDSTGHFNGTLDEIRLWGRTLSSNEIYDVYANITRKGTPDVNMVWANSGNEDRVVYKVYANISQDTGDLVVEDWSITWQDVFNTSNFPPNDLTIIEPAVNGTYYASDNTSIIFEWLGDPNYDYCWMNTTIEDSNGAFVTWYNNRSIPGWYQQQHIIYNNYITPTAYDLSGGTYQFNVTIEDNQSLSTTNIFPFHVSEVNITTPLPADGETGINAPVELLYIDVNQSYGEGFNTTFYLVIDDADVCLGGAQSFPGGNGTIGVWAKDNNWGDQYSTVYTWKVKVNYTGNSVHWRNYTYSFETQADPLANWTMLPGYDNCTLGTPDFDQKQSDWFSMPVFDKWMCDGPVAALNALWWLDCKVYNGTNQSRLENWCGLGSHNPQNVIPLVDSLICNMSTEFGVAVLDRIGTNSSNFTRGLYRMFDNWSINDTVKMEIEGETDAGVITETVNYSNITKHLDRGHAVVLLLGQYCYDGIGFGNRLGGHYVTCNGYRNDSDFVALSFADPYFDRAENGEWGWNSTHNHDMYGNGSHNWTQNVSYDFFEINVSSNWEANSSEVVNYTSEYYNWSDMNWFGSSYASEVGCDAPNENRTIIDMAWYIWIENNMTTNTTVWNSSSSSWEEDLPLATIGTHQFNFTMQNIGPVITENLSVFTTHYDCLSYYIPDSARVYYPNGSVVAQEPIRSWEGETCDYAGHGHLSWCFGSANLTDFGLNQTIHILYNMTYNCTNYSKTTAKIYLCSDGAWCQECINDYDNMFNATNCSLGKQFDHTITCPLNTSETSDWMISEHVNRKCVNCGECLDEDWNEAETEYDAWMPYNTSIGETGWRDWEWTYRYDSDIGPGDSLGLSYTIANDSCANRTQSTLRMKYNVTNWGNDGGPEEAYDPAIGTIYSFTNDSYYHMVLYSWNKVFLLTKEGNNLYNTNDSSLISTYTDVYNYWSTDWPCNQTFGILGVMENANYNGIWAKTEWNPYCGRLSTKAWNITQTYPFNLCDEPSGWIFDDYSNTYEQEVTKGVDGGTDTLEYQIHTIIDVWQGINHYVEGLDFTWSGNTIDWSPLGAEPLQATVYDVKYTTQTNVSRFPNTACFGLVTWNPSFSVGLEFYADFDFIEVWKNNYTYPPNDRMYYEDGQYHNHSMPKLNFKAFPVENYTAYLNTWNTTCQWPYQNDTITSQQYADCTSCYFRNISKLYDFESRAFQMARNCSVQTRYDNQNDTVYFYNGMITNLMETTTLDYNNAMLLEIIDTTDGHNDYGDGAIVCIDVDNNSEWDDNDLCLVWWDSLSVAGTKYFIWNGSTLRETGYNKSDNMSITFLANYSECSYDWLGMYIGEDASALLPSNHRYSNHRVYSLWLPTLNLIKSNGEYLNTSDEFGLSVMAINSGADGVPLQNNIVVWQDWNETNCTNQYLNENGSDAWSYLLNLSNYSAIEDFYTYGTEWIGLDEGNIKYFGFGQFGNETGYLNQSYYETTTQVASNITQLVNITDDQLVRYDITICNTKDSNLTNATITFSTLTTANIVATNATSFYNYTSEGYSHHVFNATQWINASNCSMIYILVNFTANYVTNGSIVNTWFYSSTDQPGSSSETNYSFDYGENTAPVINWTYPANGSTPGLALNNISCYIYDNDGDTMGLAFNTNKSGFGNQTDTWDSFWNCIGINNSVGNGHYWWNQTTNKSDKFTTRWRWGDTTYHFWINVTDGKTWTNETFHFTTSGSRYDVTSSGDIVATDVSKTWAYRQGEASYLGIYDVGGNGDITATDCSEIWANRT